MDRKIRTLLIEDSAFMRIVLSDLLRRDRAIELVATAVNGLDGVEKARKLLPDVIVTDIVMPDFDGLYVVQQVMKERPVPIILLSSLDRTDEGVFVALKAGAFDFVDKRDANEVSNGYGPLVEKVHEASLITSMKSNAEPGKRDNVSHQHRTSLSYDILVLGASTGGPGALEIIINNLPHNLPIPVVIAQHMPERFIETFAERLRGNSTFDVTVAVEGEYLRPNHIYLASGTGNMRITKSHGKPRVTYVKDNYAEFNCPSIDCLFESAAEQYGSRCIGVILSGMGKDGAKGLRKIYDRGGLTISQDETSSVVYGMPKVAFENGASRHQINLIEIPNFIVRAL